MSRKRVLLPDPFCPITPPVSPQRMSKDTSRSTVSPRPELTAIYAPGVSTVLGLPVDVDITGWHRTVALHLDDDELTLVRGDKDDVFSHGYLCPKGTALTALDADDLGHFADAVVEFDRQFTIGFGHDQTLAG